MLKDKVKRLTSKNETLQESHDELLCPYDKCRGPNTRVPQKVEPMTTEREKLLDA